MKKVVLVLLFVMALVKVNAQEKTAFEKDTYKLVKEISLPSFKPVVSRLMNMIKPDKIAAFTKEVEASYPSLFTSMTKIYMEEFSHKDIKALLVFYASPLGKKMLKKTPILIQKGMTAGQKWGMKIQGIMSKYK